MIFLFTVDYLENKLFCQDLILVSLSTLSNLVIHNKYHSGEIFIELKSDDSHKICFADKFSFLNISFWLACHLCQIWRSDDSHKICFAGNFFHLLRYHSG